MAARSILYRILQAAEDERLIVANPVRKVPAPKPEVDPEEVLGQARRRALTPEEAGRFLACFPAAWWDHVIALLGTGVRFGELGGLRRRRVLLDRTPPVLQVVAVRYQAGKYGSGFKGQPKSHAGIRNVPLAHQVADAIRRQLPSGASADDLVFADPVGGHTGVLTGRHSPATCSGTSITRRLAGLPIPPAPFRRPPGAYSGCSVSTDRRRSRSSATASARPAPSCGPRRSERRCACWKRLGLWLLAPTGMARCAGLRSSRRRFSASTTSTCAVRTTCATPSPPGWRTQAFQAG